MYGYFFTFRSERKNKSTSEGIPKIPVEISENFVCYFYLQPKFPDFLSK